MSINSDSRKAVNDLIYALRDVFKNYTRSSRRKAWSKIKNSTGDKVVEKIINNPSTPLRGLDRLIFKEWFNKSEGN